MSLTRRSSSRALCAALCIRMIGSPALAVPAVAIAALAPGCAALFKTKATPVATGELYEPGEAEYDSFFKELYEVQLLMGQAPEREVATRSKVASALELPAPSTAEAIGDAVYERAAVLAKAGVMLKLSLSGTDEGAAPVATVVTVGDVKDDKDAKLVAALDEAVKANAELVAELRRARKPLERLRGKAASLEARVDTAFAKSRSKRAEVRRNLEDARQLLPLMTDRAGDVQQKSLHFLTTLQKVLGAPTSASGPTELPASPKKGAKPAKPKATPAAKPVKPVPPPRAVPKPEPREAPPPPAAKTEEPKKKPVAKAPPEDFEP